MHWFSATVPASIRLSGARQPELPDNSGSGVATFEDSLKGLDFLNPSPADHHDDGHTEDMHDGHHDDMHMDSSPSVQAGGRAVYEVGTQGMG